VKENYLPFFSNRKRTLFAIWFKLTISHEGGYSMLEGSALCCV